MAWRGELGDFVTKLGEFEALSDDEDGAEATALREEIRRVVIKAGTVRSRIAVEESLDDRGGAEAKGGEWSEAAQWLELVPVRVDGPAILAAPSLVAYRDFPDDEAAAAALTLWRVALDGGVAAPLGPRGFAVGDLADGARVDVDCEDGDRDEWVAAINGAGKE